MLILPEDDRLPEQARHALTVGARAVRTYETSAAMAAARALADPTLALPVLDRRAFHRAVLLGDVVGATLAVRTAL